MTIRRRLLLFLLFLGLPALAVSQAKPLPEYAMKAAFVYNFALFTQWPELPDNTLRICTLNADPVKTELEQFVSKQPHGANLMISKITGSRDVKQCQVIFIAEEDLQQAPMILSVLKKSPVLIVTDIPDLIDKGAMIGIKIENNRMIFEINLESVKQSGLHLSSRLLKLARKIY